MSTDPTSIETIRNATFATGRRGYRKQDVDRFLAGLADWLAEGEGREQSTVVKEALQEVGRRTGAILVAAEDAAQELRDRAQKGREEAEVYAKQVHENAEQRAQALKESSDAEAERTRSVAARDAEAAIANGNAELRKIEEQGAARKAEIEAEIEKLGERRDSILTRIDELASQLTGTAKQHRPGGATAEAEIDEAPIEAEPPKPKPNGAGARAKPAAKTAKVSKTS